MTTKIPDYSLSSSRRSSVVQSYLQQNDDNNQPRYGHYHNLNHQKKYPITKRWSPNLNPQHCRSYESIDHQNLTANQQQSSSSPPPKLSSSSISIDVTDFPDDYDVSTTRTNLATRSSLYSMWNTFKYEFNHRFRNKFNFDTPICLLGQLYYNKMSDSINWSDEQTSNLYAYEKFKKDYYSRIWLTYRRDFPPILNTGMTTDNGWGCMIRSGQMIFAQALLTHFLGRNWRWEGQDDSIHRMIIKWFIDLPDKKICPFSIHEIIRVGQRFGKNPGDWFGPASISVILKHLLIAAADENKLLNNICCYIAQDCTVYLQDVIDLCTAKPLLRPSMDHSQEWRSIIILVPVRLGADQFNMFYGPYLKQILSMPFCLGVIGGKPRHSLYFVGFQDDKLLAIDPHYCQKSIDLVRFKTGNFPLESFHCQSTRRVSLHSIDPSCTIGFYLKNKEEYEEFIILTKQMLEHSLKTGGYPIYSLDNNRFEYGESKSTTILTGSNDNESTPTRDRILQMQYRLVDSHGNVQKIVSSEDFVLL